MEKVVKFFAVLALIVECYGEFRKNLTQYYKIISKTFIRNLALFYLQHSALKNAIMAIRSAFVRQQ